MQNVQKNIFPALRKKTIISSVFQLASKVQVQTKSNKLFICSSSKTSPLQNYISAKLNNTQIQNAAQEQQTNDILELKNMIKDLLEIIDSMLNSFDY